MPAPQAPEESPRATSRWRGVAQNLTLAAATTVLVRAAAELGARLVEGRTEPPPTEARQTNPSPGNAGFYVMPSTSPGWPPWTEFNRDGLRDRPHPLEKAPGVYRIAILGDSVTVGPDAHPEHSFPQQLRELLAERGPWSDVMSVALWGWATREEATAWEKLARPYKPDLVILAVCLNDLVDVRTEERRPGELLVALHRRLALVRLLVGARRRELERVEELFERPDDPAVGARVQSLFSEIRRLHRSVEAEGSRLAVVLFPYRAQVTPAAPEPSVQRRVAEFSAAEGLPFLDLLPSLARLGEEAFLPGDGIHLSAAGGRATADALADWPALPESARRPANLELALRPRPVTDAASGELLPLLAHGSAAVRAEAVWALGRLGDVQAIDALVRCLTDEDGGVRRAAALALRQTKPASASVVQALLRAATDPSQSVRWEATRTLAAIPQRALPPEALAALLESPDYFVRGFAAWRLGEMGLAARASLPALVAAQSDEDAGVRALVLRSLSRVGAGAPEAVDALRRALREGTDDDRWKAARSLGKLGAAGRLAIPDLIEALGDANGHVRRHSALALGRLGGGEKALEAATRDSDPAVASAATEALRAVQASAAHRTP